MLSFREKVINSFCDLPCAFLQKCREGRVGLLAVAPLLHFYFGLCVVNVLATLWPLGVGGGQRGLLWPRVFPGPHISRFQRGLRVHRCDGVCAGEICAGAPLAAAGDARVLQ